VKSHGYVSDILLSISYKKFSQYDAQKFSSVYDILRCLPTFYFLIFVISLRSLLS